MEGIMHANNKNITMAHGGGGRLMHQLIEELFVGTFNSKQLKNAHDSAVFELHEKKLAFTTDSFVVKPLFFPGGDIGSLAVYGTINDLAMCGARPLYISTGFIIEDGFSLETLSTVVHSMKAAAAGENVEIITGDTKVVEHGKGDGVYINTSGIGIIEHDLEIAPSSIKSGDKIIINRDIGCHGIAVMSVREGLHFETSIESDCAPLAKSVKTLLDNKVNIHCLRDATRGGLSAVLTELAGASRLHFILDENKIPILDEVNNACEILGLDPLRVANEGAFVLFVPASDADKTLSILQDDMKWADVSIIGEVSDDADDLVTLKTILGTERIIAMPLGEQLPRIC
jgi:hydrogenase expression/formation protein HypE